MLTLKSVGHQSTTWMVCVVWMLAVAALILGTTSSQMNRQQARYLLWQRSNDTIQLAGSKHRLVTSAILSCLWWAFLTKMTGAHVARGKWTWE